MKYEIKNRWTGAVIYATDADSLRSAVEEAVRKGSNLSGSDLRGSDLSGSNLRGSDLSGSNLSGSNLSPIQYDFEAVLKSSPKEIKGLRLAIIEGRIHGSSYEGNCACLVGTIANVAHCNFNQLPKLKPDSSRPAERFFLGIKEGDTPKTNQFSKLALGWLDEFVAVSKEVAENN